nr:galactose-1-phosphate uridylyltransferase [Spelaeicoccus albus]
MPSARTAVDMRPLPVTSTSSELRFDRLLGEWVAIASHRQSRTFLPPADKCPLCPSTDDNPSEIPDSDYQVVVFENRFPSLTNAAEPTDGGSVPEGVAVRPGYGRCEVVCFTPQHDGAFAGLSHAQARLVVDAWADRTAELSRLPHVEQVFCFENHGEEIGVTLSHPHGQIYAYPFITPRTATMLGRVRDLARDGRDLFADMLAGERAGPRVVAGNDLWTAFVPAAARWPYEVQLFPHRKVPDITALTSAERDAFVEVYLDVMRRFAGLFDTPMPYIAAWNQAPTSARDEWWLHVQLFSIRRAPGKLKYLAGSESGMGVFINDIAPEQAAERLRAVSI